MRRWGLPPPLGGTPVSLPSGAVDVSPGGMVEAGTVAGISGITFVVWEIMLAGRACIRAAAPAGRR